MAISDITGISNIELWDLARKASPKFRSHTSKGTSDLFTEKGFEALKLSDIDAINEFFELSLRVAFQMCNVSRAKNPLEGKGLIQFYDTPNGGYVQRIAVDSIKPTSPRFKGLQNGDSVDPWTVRKPKSHERFFAQNFDYQSFITLQDFQVKQIFISEYGMGEYLAGIMQGLRNGYTVQEYENSKEAMNAALNSTEYPLQDSQVIRLGSWTDAAPTKAQLTNFIMSVKDTITAMTVNSQSSGFNALKFMTAIDTEDMVLVMRTGIKNRIDVELEAGAFNPDRLGLPVPTIEIDNFGGLIPYTINASTGAPDALLQPIYDKNGEQVAYVDGTVTVNGPATFNGTKWVVNVTSGSTTADTNQTYVDSEITWLDPNASVLGFIARKGVFFENRQNPYQVSPIYNPAGLYTNYWASSPHNSIVYDPLYELVAICKPESQESQES